MTQMYEILTIAGWAWLVVAAALLAVALIVKRKRERARGFDVVAAPTPAKGEGP